MNNVLSFFLIKETKTKDSVGQTITNRTNHKVLGMQDSIGQSEFYKAEQAGIRASFRLVLAAVDYEDEDKVLVNDTEYSIYRTYKRGADRIELYCGKRVGTKNGEE